MDFSSDLGLRSGGAESADAVRTPRERALEAMVRIAAARGYQATSVADVLERAELSRSEFDAMFGDRETCFLEAYDAVVDVVVARVSEAFEAAETEMRRVRMG